MKRLIVLLIIVAILLMPMTASLVSHADTKNEYMGFVYECKDSSVAIVDYQGNNKHIQIPSHIQGMPVVEIGENAFERCVELVSVTIPKTVSIIQKRAFSFCENLEYLYIANGVSVIEEEAFVNCDRLAEVALPSSITSVGYNAFATNNDNPCGVNMVYAGFKVYGYQNSYAQDYAIRFRFVPLDSLVHGDVNDDQTVTAIDALEVLKSIVGKTNLPTYTHLMGDVSNDGAITATDALGILKIVVGKSS